jgi:hypothetical protein
LSQLWIGIKISFDLPTTKRQFVPQKMEISLKNSTRILEFCVRRHDFIIDNKRGDKENAGTQESSLTAEKNSSCSEMHAVENSPLGWGCLPKVEEFVSLPGNFPST